MNCPERREHTRRLVEVGVSIFNREEQIKATVVNLCEGGLGLRCRRAFFPGTEISLKLDDDAGFNIYGTVKWAFLQNMNKDISYRIGIRVDRVVRQLQDGAPEFMDRSEFMKSVMPET
ncbi:MAG: PilZ domain-containing protein [Thermodesulfobacteriota bacterium]